MYSKGDDEKYEIYFKYYMVKNRKKSLIIVKIAIRI